LTESSTIATIASHLLLVASVVYQHSKSSELPHAVRNDKP
jgi:hypothetical protein